MDLRRSQEELDFQRATREVCRELVEQRDSLATAGSYAQACWKQLHALGIFSLLTDSARSGVATPLASTIGVVEELGRALIPGPVDTTMLGALVVPDLNPDDVVGSIDLERHPVIAQHADLASHFVVDSGVGLRLYDATTIELDHDVTSLDPSTTLALVGTPLAGEFRPIDIATTRWTDMRSVVLASTQVGIAEEVLDRTREFCQQRHQFGRPVGSFQAIKHMAADMLVRVEIARSAVLIAALALDEEVPEASHLARSAKVLADRAATCNARAAVQMHGGMGFAWEVDIHLYLKRAWANAQFPMSTYACIAELSEFSELN